MSALAPTLQAFFTGRLIGQRGASPNTIATYRDSFCLLLGFAAKRTRKQPHQLDIDDIDAPTVAAFLDHLEADRHNSIRTRNNRLAAIHSLFGYMALRHPEHAASIQRVLAIPPKRFERNLVTFLTDEEIDALLATCDRTTWTGRRDHTMVVLAVQTGLRISELTNLTVADVVLGTGAHVHTIGKGRKEQRTPLVALTVSVLRGWIAERQGAPSDPLFPTSTGRALSRDAIEHRVALYVRRATDACPSLRRRGPGARYTPPGMNHDRPRSHHHRAGIPTVPISDSAVACPQGLRRGRLARRPATGRPATRGALRMSRGR